jgi:MFS family permease
VNVTFLTMLVIAAAVTTTKGTVELVFPPYLVAYHWALSTVGLLTSLLAVAQLASRVPVGLGYRADRGTRQFALALVVFGLSTAGLSFANGDAVAIVALIVIHGLAFGSVGTLGLALAIDATGGRSAGVSMAWYTAAISLGYALGSIVGGWLGDLLGLAWSMTIISVVPILAALVALALPRMEVVLPPDRGSGWRGLLAAGRKLDSRVWLAVASVVFINLIWDSLDVFFVIFAPTVGISLEVVGLLRAVKSAAGLAIRLGAAAMLLTFADYRHINFVGIVLAAVMMATLPLSTSLLILVPIFAALGLARGLIRATSAATIAELRREGKDVGLASGVYNAGLDLGSIAGPTLGGAVASVIGIPQMFQAVGIAGLVAWLAVALSTTRTRAAAGLGRSKVLPFTETPEIGS